MFYIALFLLSSVRTLQSSGRTISVDCNTILDNEIVGPRALNSYGTGRSAVERDVTDFRREHVKDRLVMHNLAGNI